jgi:hypothetical protein
MRAERTLSAFSGLTIALIMVNMVVSPLFFKVVRYCGIDPRRQLADDG